MSNQKVFRISEIINLRFNFDLFINLFYRGVYQVKNSMFSLEPVMLLPIENYRWTVTFKVVSAVQADNNKELGCAVIVGDILPPN